MSGSSCLPNGHQLLTTTPGAPMGNGATVSSAGGEITMNPTGALSTSNPTTALMGSGLGAPTGYEGSAYFRNIGVSNSGYPGNFRYPNFSEPAFVTDMNCYNYGYGLSTGGPQTISLTKASLGYTFLQFSGSPSSYVSAPPGGSNWGNYLYYGGIGNVSGVPFQGTDPNGGTYDFCCSTQAQNGVGPDTQCAGSQSMSMCP